MTHTQNTEPNFGEPWETNCQSIYDRNGPLYFSAPTPELASRLVQCVNACRGMTDPAAEIEAMREVIREAYTALERCKADRGERDKVLIVTTFALAKLQPFLP